MVVVPAVVKEASVAPKQIISVDVPVATSLDLELSPLDDEELAMDSSSADDTEVPLAEMAKWYLTTTRRLSRAI